MLTRKRWTPPNYTGDAATDYRNLTKSISDYLLSLEGKGSLSITEANISSSVVNTVIPVSAYGAVGDGTRDDTAALQAAAAACVANGGGTIQFEAGKNYKVFTSAGTLFALNGANGVVIEGNGATLTSAQVNPTLGNCKVFDIHGVDGFAVDSLTFIGGNTTLTSSTGEYFLQGYNGTHNVCVRNVIVKDCAFGIWADSGATSVSRSWDVQAAYFEKVYYPLACYWLDDLRAKIVTRNCGRSYFPANPCNNHDVDIDSQLGSDFSDVLIKVYARSTYSGAENTVSNIRLNYRTTGKYSGTGDQDNEEALVAFDLQQYDTNTAAGHLRNIRINFDAECNATDQFANLLILRKYKSDGTGDNTTTRGHTVRDITVSGVATNWDSATQNGVRLFSTTTSTTAQDWTGDTIENIALKNLRIEGAPPTNSIYVNQQGFSNSTQSLVIDNVNVDGTVTYANTTNGRIAKRAFVASNENNSDCEGSWTLSLGGTTTYTSRTGNWIKRGRKVTAWGEITVNAIGTGSTYVISGLPFTAAATCSGFVSYFASAATSVVYVTCYVNSGSTSVTFGVLTAAAAGITTAPNFFGSGTQAYFVVEYLV